MYRTLLTLVLTAIASSTAAAQVPADQAKRGLLEEKAEIILTDFEGRCQRMLAMQITVHNNTKNLHRTIARTDKLRPLDRQAARKIAESMKDIIREVTRMIDVLEAEGTAVAFPEVFQLLRQDMRRAQRRLENGQIGPATLSIELENIDTLREIVQALKGTT